MTTAISDRPIDIGALPWPASMRGSGRDWTVTAATAPSSSDLQAAVDAAPDPVDPPSPEARIADLEARLEAVAALRAGATVEDVAEAARKPTVEAVTPKRLAR